MNLAGIIISGQFVDALGWTLIHSLWQSLVILMIYRIGIHFIGTARLKTRYFLSLSALFSIPMMALITFTTLYHGQQEIVVADTGAKQISPLALKVWDLLQSYREDASTGPVEVQTLFDNSIAFINGHLNLIIAGWLAGTLFFMFRLAGGYFYSRRLTHHRVLEIEGEWKERAGRLMKRMHIKHPVRLLESAKVKVPLVIGFLKPVILIPLGVLSQIPADQMEAILIHEMAHILRRDYIVNLIQAFVETLFFFNPVVWWLSNRIRQEREFICDDTTLHFCGNPVIYLKALTSMQEISYNPSLFAPALSSNKNQLLTRIKRMIEPSYTKPNITGGFIMFLLLLTLITVTTSAAITLREEPNTDLIISRLLKNEKRSGFSSNTNPGSIFLVPNKSIPSAMGLIYQPHNSSFVPDTTKKEEESAAAEEAEKQYQEALKAQEQAQKRLQYALQEHQEALKQYREAIRQQREFEIQNHQKALQEYYERVREQLRPDSLDRRDYEQLIEGYYDPDTSWINVFEGFDTLYPDMPELYLAPLPELSDLDDVYIDPQIGNMEKTRSILRTELIKDGIIEEGVECVVYIDSDMMSVNGEKQSREVQKKYRRLLETATGGEIGEGYTYFY
jgi:beta-lactamase regulating signal transducer with metallopeptidase domain